MSRQQHRTAPAAGDGLWAGRAGAALLNIERARQATGRWQEAHARITVATAFPVAADSAASLSRGAPAIAFTLSCAGLDSYQPALDGLDEHVTTITQHRLDRAHRRMSNGHLPELREFDLISGLTGLGVYFLHRAPHAPVLRQILRYLAVLTEPVTMDDGVTLPGWWSPDAPTSERSPRWPGGHSNHGIAHGIAGPLALLAAAARRGVTVRGWRQAVERICQWLARLQQGSPAAPWWPEVISGTELRSGQVRQSRPGRPSWCYGTPGIGRALQSAAIAVGDATLRQSAEHAVASCIDDPAQLSQLTDASLCHGWTGLFHTAWNTAADAIHPAQFGLHQLEQELKRFLRMNGIPRQEGLLTGSTGIRLITESHDLSAPSASGWDYCLLTGMRSTAPGTNLYHAITASRGVSSGAIL